VTPLKRKELTDLLNNREAHAEELLRAAAEIARMNRAASPTKSIRTFPKNHHLVKVGAALTVAPEPLTTVLGVSLIAIASSGKNQAKLGKEISRLYDAFWSKASWRE
jgi:hypothetical protein